MKESVFDDSSWRQWFYWPMLFILYLLYYKSRPCRTCRTIIIENDRRWTATPICSLVSKDLSWTIIIRLVLIGIRQNNRTYVPGFNLFVTVVTCASLFVAETIKRRTKAQTSYLSTFARICSHGSTYKIHFQVISSMRKKFRYLMDANNALQPVDGFGWLCWRPNNPTFSLFWHGRISMIICKGVCCDRRRPGFIFQWWERLLYEQLGFQKDFNFVILWNLQKENIFAFSSCASIISLPNG